jgi:hypothetical protein
MSHHVNLRLVQELDRKNAGRVLGHQATFDSTDPTAKSFVIPKFHEPLTPSQFLKGILPAPWGTSNIKIGKAKIPLPITLNHQRLAQFSQKADLHYRRRLHQFHQEHPDAQTLLLVGPPALPLKALQLKSHQKLAYWATVPNTCILEYWPHIRDEQPSIHQQIIRWDQETLDNATKIILTTEHAKNQTLSWFSSPMLQEKIEIRSRPTKKQIVENRPTPDDLAASSRKKPASLFIASDWERKGGPQIIEIARHHKTQTFHLFGEPTETLPENCILHPWANLEDPAQTKQFVTILRQCQTQLVFSKFETLPNSMIDGACFGLIPITNSCPPVAEYTRKLHGIVTPNLAPCQVIIDLLDQLHQDQDGLTQKRINTVAAWEDLQRKNTAPLFP